MSHIFLHTQVNDSMLVTNIYIYIYQNGWASAEK